MRSELGKISLDLVFKERESLNVGIVEAINKASESWGIQCLRYEIRDIKLPNRIHEAMQMQVEAERRKRAVVLESEGIRESDINVAEGKRQARILASEAEMQESINIAAGKAKALLKLAEARAEGLRFVAQQLKSPQGNQAASLLVAEDYIKAFGNLAKSSNTLILPSNAGDVSSIVSQAMATYRTISKQPIDSEVGNIIEEIESNSNFSSESNLNENNNFEENQNDSVNNDVKK